MDATHCKAWLLGGTLPGQSNDDVNGIQCLQNLDFGSEKYSAKATVTGPLVRAAKPYSVPKVGRLATSALDAADHFTSFHSWDCCSGLFAPAHLGVCLGS